MWLGFNFLKSIFIQDKYHYFFCPGCCNCGLKVDMPRQSVHSVEQWNGSEGVSGAHLALSLAVGEMTAYLNFPSTQRSWMG